MTPFWILYRVCCNWVLPPVGRPSWETVAICHWSDKFQHLKPSPQGFGLCFTTAYHTVVVGRLWHNLGLKKFCLFRKCILWALWAEGIWERFKTSRKCARILFTKAKLFLLMEVSWVMKDFWQLYTWVFAVGELMRFLGLEKK